MSVAVLVPLLMLQTSFGIVSEDGEATEAQSSQISLILGYLLGMYGLLQAIGMIYVYPRVQKRIGLYYTGAIGSALVTAAMGSFVFARAVTDLIPLYIVLAVGNSLVRPIFLTHLSFVAPKGKSAEYIAVSNTFSNLGIMVAGQFTQLYAVNPPAAFLLGALLSALLVVMLLIYGVYQGRIQAKKKAAESMTDIERFFGQGVDEKDFWSEFEPAFKSALTKRHFSRALTSKKGQMLLLEIILDAIPDLPEQFEERMVEVRKLFVQYGHEDWAQEMAEVVPSLEQLKRIELGIPGRS